MKRLSAAAAALSALAFSPCASLAAQAGTQRETPVPQDPADTGVTVEGNGDATLAADTLEYRAMVVVGGATPADAMAEYDRAAARLPKALDQLGIKGLAYDLRGIVVACLTEEQFKQRQRNAISYGGQVPNKCEVRDYLTVRVPIAGLAAKDINSIAVTVLNAAMELGLEDPDVRRQVDPYTGRNLPDNTPDGWVPGLTYALRDSSKLYSAAAKSAIDDARAKATLHAELAGCKLGGIQALDIRSGGRVERGKLRDLRHQLVLRVRFELLRNDRG